MSPKPILTIKMTCLDDLWRYTALSLNLGLDLGATIPNPVYLQVADGRTAVRYGQPTAAPQATFAQDVADWTRSIVAPSKVQYCEHLAKTSMSVNPRSRQKLSVGTHKSGRSDRPNGDEYCTLTESSRLVDSGESESTTVRNQAHWEKGSKLDHARRMEHTMLGLLMHAKLLLFKIK
ncbi:hypothetical protein PoB_003915300 [Plakobranchus ocellatus]|uniref:Uncharacterized protein n=1 Tax=Plakobranchus ocellatus TaxID=259542 RepID=A0AAV4B0M6_9GAST|nr:hypothetical protein PoB_003915300 [Plakobranchus ocellatus]